MDGYLERYVQCTNLFLASLMLGTSLALGNSKGKRGVYVSKSGTRLKMTCSGHREDD